MARLLFKGSTHFEGVDRGAILAAAEELGYTAAERGHTLLVGSESPHTIDHSVKLGAERFSQRFPDHAVRMEVHRPDDGEVPFPAVTALNFQVMRKGYGFPSRRSSPNERHWVVAHVAALDASDVLVVLGGGSGTRLAGEIAMERHWPLVPIASFGGAARELYAVVRFELQRQPHVADKLTALNGSWQHDSAAQIISLAEQVVTVGRPHSYFISYSHGDAMVADRVELLLRRGHRSVLRDERELTPGSAIDRTLQTRIASASTFVAVYSQRYADSDYCAGELAVAHELLQAGNKPARLVALRVDGTRLPPLLAARLSLGANDRPALDAAVQKLMTSEDEEDLGRSS